MNHYGRSMASDFMSTWSTEDEASVGDNPYYTIGGDYRHLFYGKDNFPMVLDFQGAITYEKLVLLSNIGLYGQARTVQSRVNSISLALPFKMNVRAGYFLKHLGIGTNDHSLAIKRILGLSRGSETYNIEFHHLNKYLQIFYTASARDFRFTPDKYFYRIGTKERDRSHSLRLSGMFIPRTEFGLNGLYSMDYEAYGFFFKSSPIKNTYVFFETDYANLQTAFYARVGTFFFKGLDTYFELDKITDSYSDTSHYYIGMDWMVRPRLELSIKISLNRDERDLYQSHLWL